MPTIIVTKHHEQLAREIGTHRPWFRFAAIGKDSAVDIPAELTALLDQVLEAVADGASVTLQTHPDELTTTVAAAELGVSRPTLMRMIREGKIPAHKVGSHHRLKLRDVLEFRRARLQRQQAAFDELRRREDELGVGSPAVAHASPARSVRTGGPAALVSSSRTSLIPRQRYRQTSTPWRGRSRPSALVNNS